nr:organellar oligopeptidase a, chloroplastic/mitochondrial [Quercus suber]
MEDKKETKGLSSVVLQKAAQVAKSKGYINTTVDNGPWMITLDASIFDDVINNSENRNLRNELTRAHLSLASDGDHNTFVSS